MSYKDLVNKEREYWIGRRVGFEGRQYTVVDVDYNGSLLIDKKAQFTDTTAVDTWMVTKL